MPEQGSEALEGFGRLDKPAASRGDEQTAAAPGSADVEGIEEGSADAGGEDDAIRIPRARPDPMATSKGGPIDLVAAPAAPSRPAAEPDLVAPPAVPSRPAEEPDLVASAADRTEDDGSREPVPAPAGAVAPTTDQEPKADAAQAAAVSPAPSVTAEPAAEPPNEEKESRAVTDVARAPIAEPAPLPQPDPATVAALGSTPDSEAARIPPPRPDRESDEPDSAESDREPAASQEAAVVSVAARPSGPCLAPDKVADKDDDFSRNAEALSEEGFCITQTKFKERKRPWTVQTVTSGRPGPLWAVLHDDEHESFDTAVHALQTYGGVLITLETGGKRNQDGVDPNRNFSDEEISCPKLGKSAAPKFTEIFKKLIDPSQPIVALHNNFDGPVPTTGLGHVSMTAVPKDMRKVASKDPDGPLAGNNSLLLLAGQDPIEEGVKKRMDALAKRGLNVVLEPVREGKGDCSLSNYAVLSGHEDYFNVTVHHDEGEKQRKMIDAIMTGFPTVSASR